MKYERQCSISIGILNYFSADRLDTCLSSLIEHHPDAPAYEFIIVNNSPVERNRLEQVVEKFKGRHLRIKTIHNDNNHFFAPAYNQMFPQVTGTYFCFLNPDIQFRDNAIEKLADFLEKNPDYDLVGGRLISPEGKTYNTGTRIKDLPSELFTYLPFKKQVRKIFGGSIKDIYYSEWNRLTDRDIESISNAFCIIRSNAFRKVGGFNKNLRLWYSEDDLGYKLMQEGRKSRFYSSVNVVHEEGVSVRKLRRFFYYYITTRDKYIFYRTMGESRLECFALIILFIICGWTIILPRKSS